MMAAINRKTVYHLEELELIIHFLFLTFPLSVFAPLCLLVFVLSYLLSFLAIISNKMKYINLFLVFAEGGNIMWKVSVGS